MEKSKDVKSSEVKTFAKGYELYLFRAVHASMIMDYVDSIFYQSRKPENSEGIQFWNNPANTLTYGALRSLVDNSILEV